ncbi:hypothetical protein PsorP6_013510 [Peronosclerospora sorghi]|uniref:Uncharacterized protein n=1 Tax=Peronosclerospora sorghi TaxID=230839 RepID=A0ACC0VHK8_9STRA|nr:hypothetical protein PsorP6_013510 [Peronosclerospora sorghi]
MAVTAPTLPALLKALRKPSSGTAVSSNIEKAVDFFIATSSLSDAQILFRDPTMDKMLFQEWNEVQRMSNRKKQRLVSEEAEDGLENKRIHFYYVTINNVLLYNIVLD